MYDYKRVTASPGVGFTYNHKLTVRSTYITVSYQRLMFGMTYCGTTVNDHQLCFGWNHKLGAISVSNTDRSLLVGDIVAMRLSMWVRYTPMTPPRCRRPADMIITVPTFPAQAKAPIYIFSGNLFFSLKTRLTNLNIGILNTIKLQTNYNKWL